MIRRGVSILIAVAALIACAPSSSTRPATVSPTELMTNAPPTSTAMPEPTSTAAALRELPAAPCCRGRALEPGTYRLPQRLGLELSVDVPAGWRIIRDDEVSVVTLVRGSNVLGDASEWLAFFVLEEEDPAAQFQQAVLGMDDFVVVTEPAESTVAGFAAWRVDLRARPNPGYPGNAGAGIPPETQVVTPIQTYFTEGFNWTTASPEARVTILTLEVNGQDLVVYAEAPEDAAASLADALDVLSTLRPT